MINTIAIVGASGYIGKYLVQELGACKDYRVKVLTRSLNDDRMATSWPANIEIIQGDLFDLASLIDFFERDCIVVNLAYLWDAGEAANLTVTKNLLTACKTAQVKRLLHCSTAAVVGRVPDNEITETTVCCPVTEYGTTKLKIENAIIQASTEYFETAILRPTAVFGPDSNALKKLANDLVQGSALRNYLKACLFGKRRMNLVHIANVVAAIRFLIQQGQPLRGDVFIVSDDGNQKNNFADIEQFLASRLNGAQTLWPRIHLPLSVLSLLLQCLGRNNINPRCNYLQSKLQSLGFTSPVTFEDGLTEYATWYRSTCRVEDKGSAA
ncbi:NAD-dependent epimerase/dehydratase family protein [Noviherbaspirillum sedimenti]|uniref:NAD(P)-dependent oxidoreductase n=1 Tax=Noviherbaspirillum sedimenti TaxID=2320865 RepID=A0A3A3G4S4_9BURK|nr:NAD(P)-dependent oxidoreductase [Noviherbaspirillum sedimenti]RJG02931.1 NAD(P)-dependent oxidoreductase [Noviherbaspirillum sedimenti]